MIFNLLNSLFKKRQSGSDSNGDDVKPFLDHLEDMRWTIIKMVITLFVFMIGCFVFAHELFRLLEHPLYAAGLSPKDVLRSGTVVGPILSALSLSFYAGITLSFPILIYFLAEFVLPALTQKEKKYVFPAIVSGFLLFLAGVTFCFLKILPGMIKWLSDYATKSGFQVLYDVKDYFGFVAHLCIAFGLLCELPVVMVTLNGLGLIDYKWLKGTRTYAFAGVLILCAVISPTPDVGTLFVLATPIMALYELCIWVVWYLDKRRAKKEAKAAAREQENPHEPID
jgi:sec-independent protein translocase protein TatC